jgi:hypothetical protein
MKMIKNLSELPFGHANVANFASVHTTCPGHKSLISNGMSIRRTHGRVVGRKTITRSACVRMRVCADTYTYIYLVSKVSMCPKPLFYKGSSFGHVADTKGQVSGRVRKEESR